MHYLNKVFILAYVFYNKLVYSWDEEPNRIPTKCESISEFCVALLILFKILTSSFILACKFLAIELTAALEKLNSQERIENSYNYNEDKYKRHSKNYKDS